MDMSVESGFNPKKETVDEHLDASFRNTPTEEKLKAGGFMKRIFPTGFKYEFVELLKYSWPIVFSQFFSSFVRICMMIFAGHLGKYQMGGASLAVSLANLVGNSISIGMIAACDTFFSQSYGSPNKFQVGIYLQTALYVSILACIVSFAPLANLRNICLHLAQDPFISMYAEQFILVFLPALFSIALYQLLSRYLIIQGHVLPSLFVGLTANVTHVVLQYVFTVVLGLGIRGSVGAMVIAYTIMGGGMTIYIVISKVYRKTWGGWSKSSLEGWGTFMKLGVSSIMMISIEWWTFELSFFLMGVLGAIELGASSILYQMWSFYSAFSKGIGSACAYRVGRYLGATRVHGAVTAARVSICIAYMWSIVMATFTLALRYYIPLAFSSDRDIVKLARQMLPILAVFAFFGSAKDICSGIVRGTGKQVLGGIVTFVAFIIIALPIGIPLMFYTSTRAAGFWWGLNIGLFVSSTSLLTIVMRMDWKKESEKALERAKCKRKKVATLSKSKENLTYGSVSVEVVQSVKRSPGYWRCLITKRVLTAAVCFIICGFGFIARYVIFIPPALPSIHGLNITDPHSNVTLAHSRLSVIPHF